MGRLVTLPLAVETLKPQNRASGTALAILTAAAWDCAEILSAGKIDPPLASFMSGSPVELLLMNPSSSRWPGSFLESAF
jgi:hypothetical protein